MNIKNLRLLDYWIGRFVCLILTVLYRIKKIFFKKGPIKTPNKILFIKLFGIGSLVLAIPTINAVKKKYPASELYFITFSGNEKVLTLTRTIPETNIITIRTDRILNFLKDIILGFFMLLRKRVDVVIDLEFFSRFTAIFSFFIRSKYRIGFYGYHTEGLKRGSFIDFPINYNHTLHTAKAFFTLLKPLGIHQEDYDPTLPLVRPSEGFTDKINNIIRRDNESCDLDMDRWVVINPNSSDLIELRRWPEEHYLRLMDKLLSTHESIGIILSRGKSERHVAEELRSHFSPGKHSSRIVNVAGMTSLSDLIDIFHFSDLFITNDSGPAHLASLTEIPSIVIFGPETPELYTPLEGRSKCVYLGLDCQPCVTVYNGKQSHCNNNICLQNIEPDLVLRLAKENLKFNQKTASTS
jgi:ADP-heptose:LPS heptosyltransferase